MDIQELGQFESAYKPSKEVAFCWLRKQYVQLSTEEDHTEIANHANDSLRIWQAAKTQAVPEGFVLVEKTKLMQIVGSAAIIEPITRGNPLMSKYKTELDFILSTVRAVIEAQEPTND